ncbi:MAG: hypothetical protein E7429_02750 [Ruminococcaceae bacterium]|nr:hypothetical protein [Oscillospiraceae bacterium]
MKLTFVNVGYGEAILLECPDPARESGTFVMLIDGGGARAEEFADAASGRLPLAEYLRAAGTDHIDVMVSTHIHEDHLCGLVPAAELLPPGELWQTFSPDLAAQMHELDNSAGRNLSQDNFMRALNDYRALCNGMTAQGRSVRKLAPGMSGSLCDGLTWQVLAPAPEACAALEADLRKLYQETGEVFFETLDRLDRSMNNGSMMLLLDYRGTRILLPGDTNVGGYEGIDPASLRAHLFKIGHHGQLDGADQALLDKIQPDAVVCCASSDRRYNSANPEVVELLRRNGIALYCSDCPEIAGQVIPPHRAVCFTVGEAGAISAEYLV